MEWSLNSGQIIAVFETMRFAVMRKISDDVERAQCHAMQKSVNQEPLKPMSELGSHSCRWYSRYTCA